MYKETLSKEINEKYLFIVQLETIERIVTDITLTNKSIIRLFLSNIIYEWT